jgi:hypothetical protein
VPVLAPFNGGFSFFFLIVSRRDLNGSGSKGGELVAAQTPEMTGSLFLLFVLLVTSACSFSTCLGRKRKEREKWPCVTRFTAGQNSLAAHFFFSFSLSSPLGQFPRDYVGLIVSHRSALLPLLLFTDRLLFQPLTTSNQINTAQPDRNEYTCSHRAVPTG